MPSAVPDPGSAVANVRRANGGYLIVDLDAADAHSIHSMLEGSTTFFASSDDVKSKAKGTCKFGYKVRAIHKCSPPQTEVTLVEPCGQGRPRPANRIHVDWA
jgi:hypothetical protein